MMRDVVVEAVSRVGRLSGVLVLMLMVGCTSLKLDQPKGFKDGDWLTEGESSSRTNATNQQVELPMEAQWVYNAAAGFGNVTPLLVGDVVLAANRKGEVHAINFETGKKAGVKGFGHSIESTPVVEGGVLYIASAWGKKAIQAYDLQRGTEIWSRKGIPIEAGLLLHQDILLFVDMVSNVVAFDKKEGTTRWQHRLDSLVSVHAAPVMSDEHNVVVVDDQGKMVSFKIDNGQVNWTLDLETPVYATPASLDGVLLRSHNTRTDLCCRCLRRAYLVGIRITR